MIKADIIDLVHEKIGFSRYEAAEVVEAILDVLKETLQKGESIQIIGFGRFTIRHIKKQVRRNPRTGREIIVAPRKVITFKPSTRLRAQVNEEDLNPRPRKRLRDQVDRNIASYVQARVEINLPQEILDLQAVEELQVAVKEFMEAFDFAFQEEIETKYSSFFQRLQFWSKNKYTPNELTQISTHEKEILGQTILRSRRSEREAERADKYAMVAENLILALVPFDNAVIRLGEILLIKVTHRRKAFLHVEIISPELACELDKNPLLCKDPKSLLNYIERNTQS